MRFDKLRPITLIKEEYVYDIQKDFEPFLRSNFNTLQKDVIATELETLPYDSILNNQKKSFEKRFGIIEKHEKVGFAHSKITVQDVTVEIILSEINEDYLTFYQYLFHDTVTGLSHWQKRKFNLYFTEYQIVYCITKKICEYIHDNLKFEEHLQLYRNLFEGPENDFLDCFLYPDNIEGYSKYLFAHSLLDDKEFPIVYTLDSIRNYSLLKPIIFELKNKYNKSKKNPSIFKIQKSNDSTAGSNFLNSSTKIPLIKLTTSDFPDFWCYRSYISRFDKTIQKQLRETTWNNDLEDCFIDFGDENDDGAINKKEEIVNFPPDTKPFYFSLYKLELILIGDVSDKVTEKLYVADPKELNYLVKSFLREIPLDYPFDYSYDGIGKDDRREDILKKGDRNDNIYSFLQFHFGYFEGYKEDFIYNLLEITNDIWKVRTKDNQFRRELLNEWIEEKIVEYDLDRSKLGLEPPQTTSESKQLNFIDKLNFWFRGLNYLGELIFPCSIPSDIIYIEEELKTNKELIAKYLDFISEYDVFTELQSFVISCEDKIKIDGLLKFVGIQVDGLERRYLKRFDESFGTDEYKNKFYGELKGSHNLYKLMNDYEYKVDMGIRMCNQVIYLYPPPSQSDLNPEPKPTTAPKLTKPKKTTTKERDLKILARYLELKKVKTHTIVMNILAKEVVELGIKSDPKSQIRRILRENGIDCKK